MQKGVIKKGMVSLVGAGPGDPGLLTVRGLELLRKADTVIYDALVDTSLLSEVRHGTKCIFMGKRKGAASVSQTAINHELIRQARQGKKVVRLKGGDPLLFARGADEVRALRRAGVPYQIVPGVSSAWSVPAYAGISLTDRKLSSSVALVTGHEDPKKETGRVRWRVLAQGADTLVVFMGGTQIEKITCRLIQAGRSGMTPCALLYWGTTFKQRSLYATLGTVSEKARALHFKTPALLVVGKVTGARRIGRWWNTQGLTGRKVLITRPRKQASHLSGMLRDKGARVVEGATIRIRPAAHARQMDRAVQRIEQYDWLIFTSVNGVEAFFKRWRHLRRRACVPCKIRVAVIGPATRAAARRRGLKISLMPVRYQAEGLLDAFSGKKFSVKGKRILLPRAAGSRPQLVQGLRKMGAHVLQVEAYRTTAEPAARKKLRAIASNGGVDVVTFTSSSTAKNLVSVLGNHLVRRLMRSAVAASIGPITTATLTRLGLEVDIEAKQSTVPGLVHAIENYYEGSGPK